MSDEQPEGCLRIDWTSQPCMIHRASPLSLSAESVYGWGLWRSSNASRSYGVPSIAYYLDCVLPENGTRCRLSQGA